MKQSWSHKLFLRINAQIGKRPWLDSFMFFCAHWLIVYMVGVFIAMVRPLEFFAAEMLIGIGVGGAIIVAVSLGWIVSLFWKHPRPIVEYPNIKHLLAPKQTRKSFPSDHTMMAWLLALCTIIFSQMFFGAPFLQFVFVLFASLVAVSRVYVGVHYPRDIIGGILMASIMSVVLYTLFLIFS